MESNQKTIDMMKQQHEDVLEELYKVNESLDEIRKHTRLFYILAMIGIIVSIVGVVAGFIFLVMKFTLRF